MGRAEIAGRLHNKACPAGWNGQGGRRSGGLIGSSLGCTYAGKGGRKKKKGNKGQVMKQGEAFSKKYALCFADCGFKMGDIWVVVLYMAYIPGANVLQ